MTTAAPRMLHHRVDGPATAPPLVLGPSLGTSLAVWEPQVSALARHHQVIRWDLPGHGGSPADLLPSTAPGATTVADLGRLVLGLADALGVDRFAYAGISLGGAVGLWLALHHPDRLGSLAMVCSSARFGEPESWHERAALVRAKGTDPLADTATARWFTPAFVDSPAAAALTADLRAADPAGYAACCDALAGYDLRAELPDVTVPTLVVAGRDDPATPPRHARELADGIPGASLTEVAHAAHLAGVERPAPVLAVLLAHLAATTGPAADPAIASTPGHSAGPASGAHDDSAGSAPAAGRPGDDRSRHEAGMAVRRAVLGDRHVDRAVSGTTAFTATFQDFITRYAWGEIWTRPGLDRRTRSCVTLTALVARGHLEELAMHVRAALRNGLTPEEIQEVLLQTAVYCGVPAANAAFAVADRVLREEDEERPA
ncbi:bifunctional 3-oxoadipate enol-lactonase/4-carboxymuconolactone decarboxylase PcaDC [Sphaerisporangium perillae]|uniref:bifunctional 3-oxoadipate enol-lactonase/4-carboxymuconolactone decarboxylase PcaDC n=1 Tax=Sphaerisporangium perillae TaxID=2935860 RepID=UPI00201070C2|nr:3-oxoadipate enol-lactonase [Sphaerisporangium perillae]